VPIGRDTILGLFSTTVMLLLYMFDIPRRVITRTSAQW